MKTRNIGLMVFLFSSADCKYVDENGLIANLCHKIYSYSTYKCPNSTRYYTKDGRLVTKLCTDDPRSYQACPGARYIDDAFERDQGVDLAFCQRKYSAKTDDQHYDGMNYIRYSEINSKKNDQRNVSICNGYCETDDCVDEAICNNLRYGIFCGMMGLKFYVPAGKICDFNVDCPDGEDEKGCAVVDYSDYDSFEHADSVYKVMACDELKRNELKCVSSTEWVVVRIFNYTRCAAQESLPISSTYCKCALDQTNCTDPTRAVMQCPINGHISTLSKLALCLTTSPLCDNGLDAACVATTASCTVHKHLLCDGQFDCNDGSDESNMVCRTLTQTGCHRKYRHDTELQVPIHWLGDGMEDCVGGADERKIWPTCGEGALTRFVPDNSSCHDVYLCAQRPTQFIRFQDLCNGQDICGEERVCSQSKSETSQYIFTTPVSSFKSAPIITEYILHCVMGMRRSLGRMISQCEEEDFNFNQYFGLTKSSFISLPEDISDCTNVFGKVYVYLSCTKKCRNAQCPLKAMNKDSCRDRLKDRVLTMDLSDRGKLSFVVKDRRTGTFKNDNFLCDNNKCVDYDKVCDLANDCGDYSDEENCVNNFKCTSPSRYIPRFRKCDGYVDCPDFTDECNEECGMTIISGGVLRFMSWLIGGAAVVLNSFKLVHICIVLMKRRLTDKQVCKVMKTLIHVGDLMTGVYLLSIAVVDVIVYGKSYCEERMTWVASGGCAFLGILSTVGGQISLASMTCLSIFRRIGSTKVRKIMSKHIFLKTVILVSIITVTPSLIALSPLLPMFEDYFVNGMTYNPAIKIFPAFVNKDDHIRILRSHFGHFGKLAEVRTWRKINSLTDGMFSQQYNGIGRRKVHFYGNSGVCLFKYFVTGSDPQKSFVWANLLINLASFAVIFFCYTTIIASVKRSTNTVKTLSPTAIKKRKKYRYLWAIILTDFFCWVPFILVCGLHYLAIMDGTTLYPITSIVILPVNSVINPMLYNSLIYTSLKSGVMKLRDWLRQVLEIVFTRVFSTMTSAPSVKQDTAGRDIEMSNIRN